MMIIFSRKYNAREQDEIIRSMVVKVDSRERKNRHITNIYDKQGIKYQVEKLDFSDYTMMIPSNKNLDIKDDIHFNDLVSVERKNSIDEVCINLTSGRKRFKDEYERHKGLMVLMIEGSQYDDICNENYRSKVPRQSILGSLHKWQHLYDVPFIFIKKDYAGVYIYQTFKYYLKYCFDKYPLDQ